MSQEGLSMAGLAEKRMVVVESEQNSDQPDETGDGLVPWALIMPRLVDGGIAEMTFFLDVESLFPLFRLPLEFDESLIS